MDSQGVRRALRLARGLSAELDGLVRVQPALRESGDGQPRTELGSALLRYDQLIDDPELISTTRELYANGHFAQSVEEAFKYINNLVKHRTGLKSDGADLMNRAFSLSAPRLKLSGLKTQSQKDQQTGYMMMLGGAMTGIRNPRAHEHQYLDDPRAALELLCFANHLARHVRSAVRTRTRT